MAIIRKGNRIVSSSQLADGVVITSKIADNAVTILRLLMLQ